MKRTSPVYLGMVVAAAISTISASAELLHRYSFTDNANDSIGSAHAVLGQLRDTEGPVGNPVVFQDGQAVLDGTAGYIDLPNGLVSSLTEMTIETWVTWHGGEDWQRILDFGIGNLGEDTDGSLRPGQGVRYMFITPSAGTTQRMLFAITDQPGQSRPILNDALPFEVGAEVHVALTYGPNGARLFYNAMEVDSGLVEIPLSTLEDVNVWLGRSQYNDPLFTGSYNELRIHNSIRTQQELRASLLAGADTPGYDPGAALSLAMTVRDSMVQGEIQNVEVVAQFGLAGHIELTGADVTLSSSNTDVVEIGPLGRLRAVGAGIATVTAELGDQNDTAIINVTEASPELRHRYSFNESAGAGEVVDSVGGANGSVFAPLEGGNPIVLGDGQAVFPGGDFATAPYIALPSGILSSKTNVTIEVWFTWNGPVESAWQRIFDFGNSTKGTDPRNSGSGTATFFLTPRAGGPQFSVRFSTDETVGVAGPEVTIAGPLPLPIGQESHVAVVYAPQMQTSRLYVDGRLRASGTAPVQLSTFDDVNNWIGLAQWNDAALNGVMREFRMYEGPLSDLDLAISRHAGPDVLMEDPGAFLSIRLEVPPLVLDSLPAQSELFADFANITDVNINGVSGVSYSSSDTDVFTVDASGRLTPVAVGTANLTATYNGELATEEVEVTTSEPPAPQTLAYWRFEEGQAGIAVDHTADNVILDGSGNGNHLRTFADFTAPTYVTDLPFNPVPQTGAANELALSFTPNQDIYTDGKPINSHQFDTWTIEASFKPNDVTRYQGIVSKDGNPIWSPPPFFFKILAPTQRLELGLVDGSGMFRTTETLAPLQAGQWYHVAGTATATEMSLWLKGPGDSDYVLQQTTAIEGAFYIVSDRNWTVARSMWNGGIVDFFDGVIDEVRITEGVLSPAQFLAAPGVESPSLIVTLDGGMITISWPASPEGFVLQSTGALGGGADWSPVAGVEGNQVTISASEGSQFYRLTKD